MSTQDWILVAVGFYVLVAVAAAAYSFGYKRADIFEPVSHYLFFLSLFTLPLPLRAVFTFEVEGNVTPFIAVLAPFLPVAVLLAALSIPAFCAAYFSVLARQLARRLPRLEVQRRDRSRLAFAALAGFSVWLIYELTLELGGLIPFLLLGYKSSEETFGKGYLAIGFPWLFVASLLLLYRYALYHKRIDALLFAITLIANVALYLLTGNRGMLTYVGIVVVTFVHLAVRRIRVSVLLPMGLAAFVALNLMGAIRGSGYQDFQELVEYTSASSEALDSDREGLFYTLTIGEFVVPFETLPQMIRTIGWTEWPWFGWSYLRSPAYLVPGPLFPERPKPLSNWYMERFYGGGYGLNEGRAFFFLAEGYLNFGAAGVLIVAVVWGWFWGALQHWMREQSARPAAALIYSLLVGFMFRCIRGDASTIVAGVTQQSLVPAVLGLLIAGVAFRFGREKWVTA